MKEYVNNQEQRGPVAQAADREHHLRKPTKEPPPPPLPPLPSQSASPSSITSLGPYRYSSIYSATRSCCSLSHQAYHEGSEYADSEISVPLSARSLQPHPIFLANSKFVGNLPPRPAQRAPRPRLSVSPIPQLKKAHKQLETYTSLSYRLHIEQHVEKVFKYLQERKLRLIRCEAELSAQVLPEDLRTTILNVLAKKETRYLRSLRSRISPTDFEIKKELGRGVIGRVYLVEYKTTKSQESKLYAMKKLKKSQVFQGNHMAHIKAERDILAEADNDWIVKLFYSFQDSDHLYFILEYTPGGDLMSLIMDQNVLHEDSAKFYIAEISLAVQFVHDIGFIHRDIKPDNILIDARGHIKLTDFGLSTGFRWTHDSSYYTDQSPSQSRGNYSNNFDLTITRELTQREMEHSVRMRNLSLVGSPNYMAPEVLNQNRHHYLKTDDIHAKERLCDWWSVGVILYEMVIGYCPFIDLDLVRKGIWSQSLDPNENIQRRIVEWKKYLAFPKSTPDGLSGPPLSLNTVTKESYRISPATKEFIQGLLCDPEERLCQNGIGDIQNHPFFAGIDWQNIRSQQPPFVPKLSGDYDTSHFTHFPDTLTSDPENSIGGSESRMLHMNDFTYRSYFC